MAAPNSSRPEVEVRSTSHLPMKASAILTASCSVTELVDYFVSSLSLGSLTLYPCTVPTTTALGLARDSSYITTDCHLATLDKRTDWLVTDCKVAWLRKLGGGGGEEASLDRSEGKGERVRRWWW